MLPVIMVVGFYIVGLIVSLFVLICSRSKPGCKVPDWNKRTALLRFTAIVTAVSILTGWALCVYIGGLFPLLLAIGSHIVLALLIILGVALWTCVRTRRGKEQRQQPIVTSSALLAKPQPEVAGSPLSASTQAAHGTAAGSQPGRGTTASGQGAAGKGPGKGKLRHRNSVTVTKGRTAGKVAPGRPSPLLSPLRLLIMTRMDLGVAATIAVLPPEIRLSWTSITAVRLPVAMPARDGLITTMASGAQAAQEPAVPPGVVHHWSAEAAAPSSSSAAKMC